MKRIGLGQVTNTVANIGVIAGIIFLVLEIQQSNRLVLVNAEYALRDSWGTINEAIYSNP